MFLPEIESDFGGLPSIVENHRNSGWQYNDSAAPHFVQSPAVPSLETVSSTKTTCSQSETRTLPRDSTVKSEYIRPKRQRQANNTGVSRKNTKNKERNRMSALKCRQRKKKQVRELQENLEVLGSRHSILQIEFRELRGEVSKVKNLLIAHSGCNNAEIDNWIKYEATEFVKIELTS
ncbi:hypothetical protein BGZ61DRAFT_466638 [Ilyonectria robusta]|uniref:uncharacterized protein n=1 Tax=Ilyonectria robusta TaxID=1079257 RepID=UPI001E8CA6E1|nr:uncharacterized protein BGZ61DRAFT_466638 [Ilyonectria robusta]KAH8656482.1 hypothetical protein BGZ61DRAFT_466638 [Ilyonectria robusta]